MRFVLVTISTLILSGCAIPIGRVGTVDSACAVWPTTSWSKKDTDETIRGNKFNNARREGYCGKSEK